MVILLRAWRWSFEQQSYCDSLGAAAGALLRRALGSVHQVPDQELPHGNR
jgi:hypothetical protein